MAGDIRLDAEALATLDLFHGLSTAVLEEVSAIARTRHLPRETRVFHQGDDGVRAHVLIEGGVRVSQAGRDGAQIVMRFIGPGETFGTVALFTGGRYPAEAVAVADSLEASWSEAELFELMGRHPQITINVIRIVGKRLQETQNRVRELSTQRAERRIAHSMLRLARQAGNSTIDGTTIAFPLRRKDVADISGTTLHTASRILTSWEKAGLLVSRNRHLTLRCAAEILRIAEDGSA